MAKENILKNVGTLGELLGVDFGAPLHCLVIPGDMHILEKEYVDSYRIKH